MTCEVAVMNKYGVALAADSAATFGRGQKIYHMAEKIFQISQFPPVGLMLSGAAELMDMPWETIIKTYARQCGGRRFDQLAHYAADFLRWVEEAHSLFPPALQQDWFQASVRRYWKETFLDPLARRRGGAGSIPARQVAPLLGQIAAREIAALRRMPGLEDGGGYAERLAEQYGPVMDKLEEELFRPFRLPKAFGEKFRLAVRLLFTQAWIHPADQCGIVFAGMGEEEPFPQLQEYEVGTIAAGRLRFTRVGEASVSRQVSAIVAPFGMTEMVDVFYRGIDPGLEQRLYAITRRAIADIGAGPPRTKAAMARIQQKFSDEIIGHYQSPLILAVEALPRHSLATMAEALVNLTALKLRMSVEMAETVGGAIDVAILSRGDGFTWVKRTMTPREGNATTMVIP